MKYASVFLAAALAVAMSGPAAFAQAAPTTTKLPAPLQLKPASNAPLTLHMNDDSKVIYEAIGKAAGIDVLFDSDYVSKHIQFDLTKASLTDALRIVGLTSNTFYKPINKDTIFVASDTRAKHTDLDDRVDHTFYLHNVSQAYEANEIHTAIRNLLPPDTKTYFVPSQNAIVVSATDEQLARAERLINELDRAKKAYRLTYTVTETDAGKPVSTEHFVLNATDGQEETLKQGSKIPIITGSYNAVATDSKSAGAETQYTYLDVGMNFDATLTSMGDRAMLKSSLEQSSVSPEASGVGPQEPILLHTALKGTYVLTGGKPLALGTIDIPHSTRQLDISVAMEPLQ